jgi:RNA polymerase sigma-70 factor (ECF subfamily)
MLSLIGTPLVAGRTSELESTQDTSDEALLASIAARDRRAMHLLYARHNVRVFRFVLRLTKDTTLADDLVSEVFVEVWRRADTFKGQSQVSTWLLAIARHKALSALRARSDEQLDEDVAATITDPAGTPELMVEKRNRSAIVQKCLSQLSALHREVLDLVYYHGKSVQEVAQIVAVPVSTVKTRMFYARKRMEGLLAAAGIDQCCLQ